MLYLELLRCERYSCTNRKNYTSQMKNLQMLHVERDTASAVLIHPHVQLNLWQILWSTHWNENIFLLCWTDMWICICVQPKHLYLLSQLNIRQCLKTYEMDLREVRKAKYLKKSMHIFGDPERCLPRSDLCFSAAEEIILKIR